MDSTQLAHISCIMIIFTICNVCNFTFMTNGTNTYCISFISNGTITKSYGVCSTGFYISTCTECCTISSINCRVSAECGAISCCRSYCCTCTNSGCIFCKGFCICTNSSCIVSISLGMITNCHRTRTISCAWSNTRVG